MSNLKNHFTLIGGCNLLCFATFVLDIFIKYEEIKTFRVDYSF
jgi:hypothetical protein